jgi:hypothetical protein
MRTLGACVQIRTRSRRFKFVTATSRFSLVKEIMKPTRLLILMAAGLAMALSPTVAKAQGSTPAMDMSTTRDNRDEHHDYGWIGLLGLLGLAGLMKKKHDDHGHDRR